MASSTYFGADTENFIITFDELTGDNADIELYYSNGYFLFVYLIKFAHFLGVNSFFVFKFFAYIIVSLFIWNGLRKFTANFYLVVFLYLIGAYIDDTIQIRNTIAVGILVLAFKYLYDDNDKYKAPFLLFLATMIHVTFIFFFLLLLIRLDNKFIINLCFWSGIVLFFILFYTHDLFLIRFVYSSVESPKYGGYAETTTHLGPLIPFLYYLYVLSVIFFMKMWVASNKRVISPCKNIDIVRFIDFVYDVYKIMAVPLFTCVLALSAWRYYRDIMLFFIVAVVMFYYSYHIHKIKRLIILYLASFIVFFYLYFGTFYTGSPDETIYAFFNGDISVLFK